MLRVYVCSGKNGHRTLVYIFQTILKLFATPTRKKRWERFGRRGVNKVWTEEYFTARSVFLDNVGRAAEHADHMVYGILWKLKNICYYLLSSLHIFSAEQKNRSTAFRHCRSHRLKFVAWMGIQWNNIKKLGVGIDCDVVRVCCMTWGFFVGEQRSAETYGAGALWMNWPPSPTM